MHVSFFRFSGIVSWLLSVVSPSTKFPPGRLPGELSLGSREQEAPKGAGRVPRRAGEMFRTLRKMCLKVSRHVPLSPGLAQISVTFKDALPKMMSVTRFSKLICTFDDFSSYACVDPLPFAPGLLDQSRSTMERLKSASPRRDAWTECKLWQSPTKSNRNRQQEAEGSRACFKCPQVSLGTMRFSRRPLKRFGGAWSGGEHGSTASQHWKVPFNSF